MPLPRPSRRKVEKPFPPLIFALTVIITLAIVLWVATKTIPVALSAYVHASWWVILLTFVSAHLFVGALGETLFHRYCFHTYPIPLKFFKRLYEQHVLHHGLTNVKLIHVNERGVGRVFSRYEILEEKQHEASYFPWYALLMFEVVACVLIFVPLQMMLPHIPVLLCGIVSVAWSLVLYELLHALEHLSYKDYWKPKLEHPVVGRFWKVAYCFHLRHHADTSCNEAVGGFFGLPVWDWILGTYKSSRLVLLDGVPAIEQDFESPRPIWIIRVLDRWAKWSMDRQKPVKMSS